MARQALVDWLDQIGQEIFIEPTLLPDGTVTSRTNDEQLARLIWRRALGYREIIEHPDGTKEFRNHFPDAKAQQFIFERREGKFTTAQEGKSISPLDRISELIKSELNKTAHMIVDEQDANNTET